ncbi:MAG: hypothetical protein IKE31_10715 [Eubacterium sp.]|nr:hypothetical protein [Eubacterium sp.]
MAGRYRTTTRSNMRRVNTAGTGNNRNRRVYVDGNTVRVLDDYEEYSAGRKKKPLSRKAQHRRAREDREILASAERSRKRRIKRMRAQQKRNKALAHSMGAGYMLMLTVVCVLTLCFCIHYLQLRSQSINQSETIAEMESSLNRLRADNDAFENELHASLNLEEIKDTALNKLGLHYATESQIRYYNADNESYVRQYKAVSGD